MLVVDIAKDGLVDRTSQREAEVRVLTVNHVRKVLVRHDFEDGTGDFRQSGLRVVAVENLAASPLTIFILDVQHLVVQQSIGEVARCQARDTGIELAAIVISGTDGQRTNQSFTVLGISCIAMYSQRQFERHLAPGDGRHVAGTAS